MTPAVSFEVTQARMDREQFVRMTKNEVARREKQPVKKKAMSAAAVELTNMCLMLHQLAQKYVPRTPQTFRDFDVLAQATRVLQKMGLSPSLAANVCAPASAVETATILNSPEYRKLHNRFVAALATIADMTEKNTPPGHPEYQRGVREGYRRASDIAILFLEDLHTGVKK